MIPKIPGIMGWFLECDFGLKKLEPAGGIERSSLLITDQPL
jgi:hypothetical protein